MKRNEELPISLTGYHPLEDLPATLITLTGMKHILKDRNLGEGTAKLLKDSEAKVFKKELYKDYRYLLEDHDADEVYFKCFKAHNSIGKAHLSMLIRENYSQTYAELVAAYCADKRLPYLAAFIILEDYKKVCGSLTVYARYGGSVSEIIWNPPQSSTPPPVNYRKMLKANIPSRPGANDDYVLAALKDMCFNRSLTAKALQISEYLLKVKLTELNVLREDGTLDKTLVDSILGKKVRYITEEKRKAEISHREETPMVHTRPPAKKNSEDKVFSITQELTKHGTYSKDKLSIPEKDGIISCTETAKPEK